MPISDITLSGGMRADLIQLQLVTALQNRTTERLSTGKRVNNATDDPQAYFAAQDHLSQASDLANLKADMGEALQTVSAADNGIKAITNLIEQAKGLVASARSANTAGRAALATQFDALRTQIDRVAADSGYKGKNFLAADTLTVSFNAAGTSTLDIAGFDASTTGLAIAAAAGAWATAANIDAAQTSLDAGLATLRSSAATLASNNSIVSARQDFTTGMIATLTTGANDLTAADPNEESANMLALQTRQQLGVAALGLANQAQQSILRLF
jgi:flagellin-like hook-associated protein FlgL